MEEFNYKKQIILCSMSAHRRNYSPISNYKYSTAVSPSYSYSRVSGYLDALEKDQTISKLRKQVTQVKSIQMKYTSLLQEIAIAEKENRLLQDKNDQIQRQYLQRVKHTKQQVSQLEDQMQKLNLRITQQQKNANLVESEIQQLLEQLKNLKIEQDDLEKQTKSLQSNVNQSCQHLTNLTEENKKLTQQRGHLQQSSKSTAQQMQSCMLKLNQMTQKISQYEEQMNLLEKQSQNFSLQQENLQIIVKKNNTLIENLQRKMTIQQGENQQLKTQLKYLEDDWEKCQNKVEQDKQNLYQNIISVEQNSNNLKQTLKQLDNLLERDSTEKKYLKDISVKQSHISGQNNQMRQLLNHLQSTYQQKKGQQIKLIEQVRVKLNNDKKMKQKLDSRDSTYESMLKNFQKN